MSQLRLCQMTKYWHCNVFNSHLARVLTASDMMRLILFHYALIQPGSRLPELIEIGT